MASNGEPGTGAFLQQFTNSVSRALHKQSCQCNGRTYTAGELRLKSNPAIFAPSFFEIFRQSDISFLPVVRGSGEMTIQASSRSYPHPKGKSEYEFEPHRPRANPPRRVKKLGKTSPSKRPRKEVTLPEKLDVTDKSGQNWQIVQNVPKHPHRRKSGRLRPIVASQIVPELLTPPNTSRLGDHAHADDSPQSAPGDITRSRLLNSGPSESNINRQRTSLEVGSSSVVASLYTPSCKVLEFIESPQGSTPATRGIPQAISNHLIAVQGIQNRHITHKDFRRDTLAPSHRQAQTIANHDQTSQPSLKKAGIPSLQSLTTDSGPKLSKRYKKPQLPLVLEDLYTRGGLKISTLKIDMEGISDNFLHKNRKELRQMYPMYDWRIAHGTREPKLLNTAPTIANKDVPIATSTLQLPTKITCIHQTNSPKEKSRLTGMDWKRHRKALRTNDRLDKVKEGLDKSGETAMSVEQVGGAETAQEFRPSSGLVPRQPPPTPMDGRRKRTVETQL